MRFMPTLAMQRVKYVVLEFDTKIRSFTVRKFHAARICRIV
jgi:hypothetical protein